MDGENERMATMQGFSFYNIPEISVKLDFSMFLGVSYNK